MIDELEYRRVIGHFATGVTVVAARDPEGRPCGLTASSVASVSLDPLLVLVCLDTAADSHDRILRRGAFSINVLAAEDVGVARRFSGSVPRPAEKFRGIEHREEVTGSPILEGALAWVDCELWKSFEAGDHTIAVGKVVAGGAGSGEPLIHFRGTYGGFQR